MYFEKLKKLILIILKDPLYTNSLYTMLSTFIMGGLGFIFWIIIAHTYKTEYVGIATTLISVVSLIGSLGLLGFNVTLNRFLPKSENKNELINTSLIVTAIFSLIFTLVYILFLHKFSPDLLFIRRTPIYLASFTVFAIIFAWNNIVESAFMAYRGAHFILIKNIILSITKLILPLFLIAFGAYGIFSANALAITIAVAISFGILVKKYGYKITFKINKQVLNETKIYSVNNYLAGIFYNAPSLILPIIIIDELSAKVAAYYYIDSMIQNLLLIIPTATSQAFLTEGSYNTDKTKRHLIKTTAVTFLILLPITLIIVLFGNILLHIFGKSYASEAFTFLRLYSVSTIFTALIFNWKHHS